MREEEPRILREASALLMNSHKKHKKAQKNTSDFCVFLCFLWLLDFSAMFRGLNHV